MSVASGAACDLAADGDGWVAHAAPLGASGRRRAAAAGAQRGTGGRGRLCDARRAGDPGGARGRARAQAAPRWGRGAPPW